MTVHSILGTTSAANFLSTYWQQSPLLVQGALPDWSSPITADELAGLSLDDDVESRVVLEQGPDGPWDVQHGPFSDSYFSELPASGWTLLVQAVDLWVPQVKELLAHFSFLPPWRLDDIMVSFAPPGGSVGPHFDHYDVFLLQVEGQREWQIGEPCSPDTPLVANTGLRIIDGFTPVDTLLLDPGDMLYLPPGVGHWGIARTDCLTFSIGFRSPTMADMLGDLAMTISGTLADVRYSDPLLSPSMASATIHPDFVAQAKGNLKALLDDDDLFADWFARFMTAAKYPDLEDETGEVREAFVGQQRYRNGERED